MISMARAIALFSLVMSALALGCSPKPVVTQAEFDALTTGDTLAQVQAKIGGPGAKVSEAGEIQIWQWANAGGSNALITFGPTGMTSKAQAGLK
jgi:hypothetical protein